jgi:hypothetical protein
MIDLPETNDRITARLDDLERRISLLEHPSASPPVSAAAPAAQPALPQFSFASGALPVLGHAMLGIAGAYLLRALAESGALPRIATAAVAILYAFLWLAAAARVRDRGWPASITYACTSALILAPMLWELTLTFNLLPTALTAAVLAGFAALASLLAHRRPAVIAVAHTSAAAVALALAIATHSLLPFLAVLLLLTALAESAFLRGHSTRARLPVALAADIGLWALIYIYMGDPATRMDYPSLDIVALLLPSLAFFAIVATATVLRALVQHQPVPVFEILQTTIAFLLAASALLVLGPPSAAFLLGCICLALAVAGYTVVLLRSCDAAGPRTQRVYAFWSAALLLAGGALCLPPQFFASLLAILAVAAVLLAARHGRPALQLHAMLFLAAAAAVSGLPAYAFRSLAATPSGIPPWSLYLVAAAAAYCYFAARPQPESTRTPLALRVVAVLILLASLAALAAGGLVGLVALRWLPQPHHLAFIRTLTLCVAALALAYSGAHWRRIELSRIGYAVLILVAVKLLIEDLRHGHLAFIAASIFLFAITLIAVPRIARSAPAAQIPE